MEQMQHLHGASSGSPLPLPSLSCLLLWSDAAVPAPKAAHGSTVVCRAGARRGEWEDGCNPRQFRETLVSSLEDTGLPHLGARSHLLLDIETPGFPLQDGLRAPPGEAEGGSCSGWAPSAPFTLDLGLRAAVTPQQGLPLPPAQNVKKPPACVLTPKTVNLPSPPPGEISETLCVHLVTSLLIFGLPRLALGEDSQAG